MKLSIRLQIYSTSLDKINNSVNRPILGFICSLLVTLINVNEVVKVNSWTGSKVEMGFSDRKRLIMTLYYYFILRCTSVICNVILSLGDVCCYHDGMCFCHDTILFGHYAMNFCHNAMCLCHNVVSYCLDVMRFHHNVVCFDHDI